MDTLQQVCTVSLTVAYRPFQSKSFGYPILRPALWLFFRILGLPRLQYPFGVCHSAGLEGTIFSEIISLRLLSSASLRMELLGQPRHLIFTARLFAPLVGQLLCHFVVDVFAVHHRSEPALRWMMNFGLSTEFCRIPDDKSATWLQGQYRGYRIQWTAFCLVRILKVGPSKHLFFRQWSSSSSSMGSACLRRGFVRWYVVKGFFGRSETFTLAVLSSNRLILAGRGGSSVSSTSFAVYILVVVIRRTNCYIFGHQLVPGCHQVVKSSLWLLCKVLASHFHRISKWWAGSLMEGVIAHLTSYSSIMCSTTIIHPIALYISVIVIRLLPFNQNCKELYIYI